MNTVLISHSYFYKLDAKQWRFKQPYPPLGTLLAAAVIRGVGFDVSVFDTALADHPTEVGRVLKNSSPTFFVLYDDGFNYLTKMCLSVMREAAFSMAELAKQQGATVIICSSDSTDHYEKYFVHGVDYVVRGEGEETLTELLLCLKDGKNIDEVHGLAFRKNNETIVTSPRSVMRNLDTLPMPAWDLIDIEPYRKIWKEHHHYFSLNIATTRGCPYKCNWCAKPIYGNRYNTRSPQKVANEIEYLLQKFQPDHIWMCDDIFGLKPGWTKAFRNEVVNKGLSFKYKIQSRVDLLLEEDTIDALAESGAETIWVGAESGSQKILDAMDKGTTVQQIYTATQLIKLKKIKVAFFLQFGYLSETKRDIDSTINMVLDLMPHEIGISVSYPLPGTKFYEKVKETLHEKKNWSDSDDLAMMFESTFSPAYYKVLHRYVHSRYRIQRGINHVRHLVRKPFGVTKSSLRMILSMVYNTFISVLQSRQLKKLSRTNGNS